MASPFYQAIAGKFVIVGKQPDGDSVRFIADNPDYEQLQRSFRIRLSRDRSVQLRLEGGIWAEDATSEFELVDKKSITAPNGQLILPKLFRRSIDYLKAVDKGFRGNLKDWLIENSKGSRNENDRVVTSDGVEVNLSDLIQQRNSRVAFQADLLNITFVEK